MQEALAEVAIEMRLVSSKKVTSDVLERCGLAYLINDLPQATLQSKRNTSHACMHACCNSK